MQSRQVLLVDFQDGDERDVCSKCERRFTRDPVRCSSMCYTCDPWKDEEEFFDFDEDDELDDDLDDDDDFLAACSCQRCVAERGT
jgi:hypothetical protein